MGDPPGRAVTLHVQLPHSDTPGDVPVAADLADGELAVNVADLALYVKDATGVVQKLSGDAPVTRGGTAPAAPVRGDLWIDISGAGDPQLKIYSGAAWVLPMLLDGVTLDATGANGAVQFVQADAGTF